MSRAEQFEQNKPKGTTVVHTEFVVISGDQMRISGVVVACFIGIAVPAFLLGPWLFNGVPFRLLHNASVFGAAACALFGLWLFTVSLVANTAELENVIKPFEASEAVVFFLPCMLVVGTISIRRWLIPQRTRGAKSVNE